MDIDDKILQLIPAPAGMTASGRTDDGEPFTQPVIAFALTLDTFNNQRVIPLAVDEFGCVYDASGMVLGGHGVSD